MMQYDYPLPLFAPHASDLIPLFMNNVQDALDLLDKVPNVPGWTKKDLADWLDSKVMSPYQTYLSSFAISGKPTAPAPYPNWDVAVPDSNGFLTKVMTVEGKDGVFFLSKDNLNGEDICKFWLGIAQAIVAGQPTQDGGLHVQNPNELGDL